MPFPHKKSLVAFAILFMLGAYGLILFPPARVTPAPAANSEYIVYVPDGLDKQARHPLVILLSPSGDAGLMIQTWKGPADRFKWVLLASKKFHNGIPGLEESRIFNSIASVVRKGWLPVPIDQKRIMASGISGGGMGSHSFVFEFPDLISGVVINTGMMDAEYYFPKQNEYPRDKFAVFLASPTDFRYQEMNRDQAFLKNLGWTTKWIEFEGGHTLAPQDVYLEAAQWVDGQWNGK